MKLTHYEALEVLGLEVRRGSPAVQAALHMIILDNFIYEWAINCSFQPSLLYHLGARCGLLMITCFM